MRKATLAMIIVWSIIALVLVGVIITGVVRGGFGISWVEMGNSQLLVDRSFSAKNIDRVSINLLGDEIKVFVTDEGEFRIKQYGINLPDDRIIKVDAINSSELKIYAGTSFLGFGDWISFGNKRSIVEIYVPRSYVDDLYVNLTSGSFNIQGELNLKDFYIKMSSGSLRSEYLLKAQNVDIGITSGSLKLFGGLHAEHYEIDCSSGTIEIERRLWGSGNVEVTSGRINLEGVDIQNSLKVRNTSGTVNLTLVNNPSLDFSAEVSSGTIRTYFETTSTGNSNRRKTASFGSEPRKKLDVKVTSGTINIKN